MLHRQGWNNLLRNRFLPFDSELKSENEKEGQQSPKTSSDVDSGKWPTPDDRTEPPTQVAAVQYLNNPPPHPRQASQNPCDQRREEDAVEGGKQGDGMEERLVLRPNDPRNERKPCPSKLEALFASTGRSDTQRDTLARASSCLNREWTKDAEEKAKRPRLITAMSSAAPSDDDLFEGEFSGFIPGETQFKEGDEVSAMITPDFVEVKTSFGRKILRNPNDAFGGFGGLTDQMMDNEEPEKRLVLIHNDRWKRGMERLRVNVQGPGGHTILRGLDGQTVNEEEEQERKEMEELATQIAAEEEMMKEEEAAALALAASTKKKKKKIEPERTGSSVSLRPASKKAKKKRDYDDDADANGMKMAMGVHGNRKLTRKGQPDDKKKKEEEERLAREEAEKRKIELLERTKNVGNRKKQNVFDAKRKIVVVLKKMRSDDWRRRNENIVKKRRKRKERADAEAAEAAAKKRRKKRTMTTKGSTGRSEEQETVAWERIRN
ncbi:hypothetical protein BLNAU_1080 [Blattamonas nauphoetae]|uniref:Uncharacterized protein n=1 Tax=Blattamonas nauphoetae TaxID=2049346 RepID=A0ABQ9YJT1_9EUKA|nr:hypothetical protein BLNAU_1080 [Blattamonas nauphoetae]